MPTLCSAGQLEFEGLGSRKVTASFDGGAITSNAGALLLRQADRRIGLHSLEALIAQRVHGIALGYEDLNDHDELRHDPVLGLVSGKLAARRSGCAVLAAKSTLNRLEHAPRRGGPPYESSMGWKPRGTIWLSTPVTPSTDLTRRTASAI